MSDGLSTAFLDQARRFWQERPSGIVSGEDASEAIRGIVAFSNLLEKGATP